MSGRPSRRGGAGRGGAGRRNQPPKASQETAAVASQETPVAESPRDISQFDGNTEPPMPGQQQIAVNRNVDVGFAIHAHANKTPVQVVKRPPPSKLGREILVGLNAYNIAQLPTAQVFQYAVLLGNGDEKKPVIRKLWASKQLKDALPKAARWIFDGDKIAYSTEHLDREIRILVDLDIEEGRETSNGRNVFKVAIKETTSVRFDSLQTYLQGKADFFVECLEAVNFLDHLLRESPAQKLTAIKRNFFPGPGTQQQRFPLSTGIEGMKGIYASARMGHSTTGAHQMIVNVDVANGAFWADGSLSQTVANVLNLPNESAIAQRAMNPQGQMGLRRLRRLHVEATHRKGHLDSYVIERILDMTPKQCKLAAIGDQPATNVEDYFAKKYGPLRHRDWPAVKMTKKNTILPLECLRLKSNQRYNAKLDERQVSNMIKMAVTIPSERWQDIQKGLRMLDWQNDPYLKAYGMKVGEQQLQVKARVIPNPKVAFAGSDLDPKTTGRWRIDGKKFLTPNKTPLKSWGVCIIPDQRAVDRPTVERFIAEFVKIYGTHGGRVETRQPHIHQPSNRDVATAVAETWKATGDRFQMRPQILLFILPSKDVNTYGRIKKSCECRFGVVSQCLQAFHVQKAQAQYISNVCMKFNAKLGGTTCRAIGPNTKAPTGIFKEPTMIVSADVTHPAPRGQSQASDEQACSIAAITTSQDKIGARYSGLVQSNGYRVEMVQSANWDKLFAPQVRTWMSNVGGGRLPSIIFYFRDGVSEGQYGAVLTQEVEDMRSVLRRLDPKATPKIVVCIITKRHHIRLFPKPGDSSAGDRNGNVLPGTLVETGVTQPFENNFYLCSHVALKGTARPVMVNVLLNEPNYSNEMLQTLIYEHSYQFMRSTTPVSLFPGVYYADICAQRGRYHDESFGAVQQPGRSAAPQETTSGTPTNVDDLLDFAAGGQINEAMWYI